MGEDQVFRPDHEHHCRDGAAESGRERLQSSAEEKNAQEHNRRARKGRDHQSQEIINEGA